MNAENTGKFISELRKENNITQAELAERLMVSDKAISRWETGRGMPDISNLESIAETFNVTITELIKGERLSEEISKEEIQQRDAEILPLMDSYIMKGRIRNTLFGLLVGVAILILTMVHLWSPMYIKDYQNAVTITEMPGGELIAVTDRDVAGIEISSAYEDPDSHKNFVFLSCYQTRWNKIRGKSSEKIAFLGGKEVDAVYYYPTGGDDKLIFTRGEEPVSGGVISLPRLVYNQWLLIGAALSIIGVAACYFFRKKYFSRTLFKIVLAPIAITLSIPLCLIGHFDEVYNATYFFSGIMLIAGVIYVALLLAFGYFMRRRGRAESQ